MADSSHYYDLEGNAVFEVPNKSKGGMRRTTVADARKMGLLPSCTTILKVLANPQLERWKFQQIITASLTLPREAEETEEAYFSRIIEDAFKQVDDAADLGTRIHKAIEDHFQGRKYDKDLEVYVAAVDKWCAENGVEFIRHELRMASEAFGFAGTTDALIRAKEREGMGILDFKTRKTKPDYPCTPYQTEPIQIAAYGHLQMATFGCNVYISSTEPGRVEAVWYDNKRMFNDFAAFQACRQLWGHLNKFS